MTHPDILAIERHGFLPLGKSGVKIGRCIYCEENIYDDSEPIESRDGLFCDMDCCCEYYEIRKI